MDISLSCRYIFAPRARAPQNDGTQKDDCVSSTIKWGNPTSIPAQLLPAWKSLTPMANLVVSRKMKTSVRAWSESEKVVLVSRKRKKQLPKLFYIDEVLTPKYFAFMKNLFTHQKGIIWAGHHASRYYMYRAPKEIGQQSDLIFACDMWFKRVVGLMKSNISRGKESREEDSWKWLMLTDYIEVGESLDLKSSDINLMRGEYFTIVLKYYSSNCFNW